MKSNNQNSQATNTRTNANVSQSGGKRVENKYNLNSGSGHQQPKKSANKKTGDSKK